MRRIIHLSWAAGLLIFACRESDVIDNLKDTANMKRKQVFIKTGYLLKWQEDSWERKVSGSISYKALRKEKKREKTEEKKYISKRHHNATNRATRKQRLNIFSPSINKVEAMKSVEVKRDVRTAVTKQEKEHI